MWLKYALDIDGNLVSINDVKRGKTNTRCPYCYGELTAKKGRIKAHHFAHTHETCNHVKASELSNLPLYDRFDLGINPKYLKEIIEDYELGYRRIRNALYLEQFEVTEYNEYAARGRGAWQYTKLGKMVLGDLSLMLFNQLQEPRITTKLESIEESILGKKDFVALLSAYPYRADELSKIQQQMQGKIIDYQIYLLQYRRILINNLYFLEIQADGDTYYKIGITTRNLDDRTLEIERDLRQHFQTVSIKGLGFWQHRGNVEYYFKYRYRKYNHRIGSLTEYFKFDDVKPVLRDLRRMKAKQLSIREQEILENKPFDKTLLSLYISHGMQKSKEEDIHIGRPKGKYESTQQFLAKPKSKKIAAVLKKGLSLRETAKRTGVAVNTVKKVKALLEQTNSS